VRAGFRTIQDRFEQAAEGLSGEEALEAMGKSYLDLLQDRPLLQAQMQAYTAASDDPEIRDVVRRGFGELVTFVERTSGADPARLSRFFAKGMLLNVLAAMDLLDSDEIWARHLMEGCREDPLS